MPETVINVCMNANCTSLGAQALVRDIEELAWGHDLRVEEWGCLGKCGKGPNIEVTYPGNQKQVKEGVRDWKKCKTFVENVLAKEGGKLDSNAKTIGKKKFAIRREDDPALRLNEITQAIGLLGGDDQAAKSQPKQFSDLLVLRSKEYLKTKVEDAVKDAEWAVSLIPQSAQAKLALGVACEAAGKLTEGLAAFQEALAIGTGLNKPAVKRQITRIERKVTAAAAAGETATPAPAPAAPAPAAAEQATAAPKPKPKPKTAPKKAGSADRGKSPAAKSKSKSASSASTASKTVEKKDVKEKPKEKDDKEEKEAVAKVEEVQRDPLEFLEWQIESVSQLNHNCILMRLKSLHMESTSRDPDPGAVWHVDFLHEQGLGKELKRAYTPISKFGAYREGTLEFMIKIYKDGQMTQYLSTLTAGSNLLVSPPVATHSLEDCKDLVMIAGGSAVTVAIQICEDALRRNPKDVPVQLLLCNSTVEDVLYQEVFDEILKQHSSFRLVHCISGSIGDKKSSEQLSWHNGRINKDVIQKTSDATTCMASGPSGLMKAASQVWKDLGQSPDHLHILDEILPADAEGAAEASEKPKEQEEQSQQAVAESSPAKLPEPVVVAPKAEEKSRGLASILGGLFRPLMCTTCSRPTDDDSEGVPAVRSEAH